MFISWNHYELITVSSNPKLFISIEFYVTLVHVFMQVMSDPVGYQYFQMI